MKIDRNLLRSWLLNDDIYNASQGAVHQISTALEGPLLLLDEKKAVELSTLVADVVSDRHSAIWRSISGHDNSLEDIGINSAQMMRLSHMINKQFGAKVLVEMLGSKDMTIRKLAALLNCREVETIFQKSCSVDGAKVAFLQDRVAEASRTVLGGLLGLQDQSQQHVFLTGATGYLGVQILVQLLQSKHIGSVAVLVRSADEHQAMMRVKNTIAATEESIPEENLLKIRAWSGDLSKTNLGLSEIHSNEFSALGKRGRDGNKKSIDTIIHCGAVVDWRKTYRELEAANVSSTEQLLKLALKSSGVRRFVFISGGRYPDPTQEYGQNLHQMYLDTAKGSGYAQTKFVAEQLVDNVRRATHYNTSIDIVSPAYLIGSQKIGLANQDDYLWRIVWASVRIGAFNADENDQWLFVADSASLAERIVALAEQDSIASSLKNTTLQVHDGLGMQEFWRHVCDVLGVSLAPVTGEEWLRRVKEDMEGMRDHLLWPLAETIDASYGQLTQQRCLAVTMGSGIATAGIDLAIQQNIQRLKKTEFFG
ncbi:uncharacterized protein RCC_03972 [Ramularia collo-cygni]|uniref:Carrier domain-containing protein n=1 Tax=Ramularia collo-cygni TaxID=112498 RepID=A0A2D3UP38_9PEZI|nr:uncharacterized protein RCC_03972 [Ramularia collo-cygni]CZT18132.1 uncharacterized protein RCC_03972 [Ramularia collo-cygni]